MMINLNQRVITWLKTNPDIRRIYAVFGEEKADTILFYPVSDKPYEKQYIDGSKLKTYTLALNAFKTISRVTIESVMPDEAQNIQDLFNVEKLVEWAEAQNRRRAFPDFSPHEVESITILTRNPTLAGQSTDMAKWMCQFRITYIDRT